MNKRERLRVATGAIALSALVILGGCQGKEEGERAAVASHNAAAPAAAVTGESAIVEEARQDLARRVNRPPEEVELLENRAVAWKSAALGCPQPDESYAQVVTRGWLIRFAVGGAEYRYHSGENGPPFTCNPRQAEPPLPVSAD